MGVPNKNDPKYQTLPYNAKLFAPFINKHQPHQQQQQQQQHQLQQQHNYLHFQQQQQQHQDEQDKLESVLQQMQLIGMEQGNNSNSTNHMTQSVQSMNFENNLRLHQLLSQNNQHNAKSAAAATVSAAISHHQQQSNGPQSVHSGLPPVQQSGNISKGKPLPVINSEMATSVRPNNFLPTGAPNSQSHSNALADLNGLLNSQVKINST